MKVYFIFNLKKEFITLYKGKEHKLYEIMKRIYKLERDEINLAYNLFHQMINPINDDKLNKLVYQNLKEKIPYSMNNNTHNINNTYLEEISKLKINRSYLKLICNKENNDFFKILQKSDENFFACDFKNQSFFFINDIKAC